MSDESKRAADAAAPAAGAAGADGAVKRNPKASSGLAPAVEDYLFRHIREPPVLARLRERTLEVLGRKSVMQITADEGQFLAFLVGLLGAKKCVEVGVFTGYSATSVALALPEGGKLWALDVSEEFTSIAREFWVEAGVEDKVELQLGPATESLEALLADGHEGTFDFAFIDANKNDYDAYYELCLRLLRKGGVLAIDNVLWHGRVVDESDTTADTEAIRAINDKVLADKRVAMSMTPIGDGVTLVRKL